MNLEVRRRQTHHSDEHEMLVPGPELGPKTSEAHGFWQTISTRPGMNISAFDASNKEKILEHVQTEPCVSMIFLFSANGDSWLYDKHGTRSDIILHRPGRFYFTYAPTITPGVNRVPAQVRTNGVDIRLSMNVWNRINAGSTAFAFTVDHPYHVASSGSSWVGMLPVSPELRGQMRCIYDAIVEGNSDLIVEARGLDVVNAVRAVLANAEGNTTALARDRSVVEVAKAKLKSALDRSWTVSELAEEVGISHSKLKSAFPAHAGMPVYMYLQEARLTEAHRLFQAGGHRVTDVSIAVGYDSLSHFSALFRRRFGLSPSELIKTAGPASGSG